MKDIIETLFIDNWIRKLISLFLACVIWFIVHKSLTESRNFHYINTNIIEEDTFSNDL